MENKPTIDSLLDPKFYLESFTKLKGKTPGLTPFILNEAQKDLFNALSENSRVMILKSRQMGFSTAATGYLYHKTITTPGTNTALIGYNSDLVAELLDKVKTFYRTTPEALRPRIQYNSKFEMSFPDIDSKLIVLPSSENVGRGYTLHNVLCVSGDTIIFTQNGEQKKVSDVVKGDRVINGNGDFSTVVGVARKIPDNRMLSIGVSGMESLEVTEDHKILVKNGISTKTEAVWKKASDITSDDYVAYPIRKIEKNVHEVKVPELPKLTRGGNTFFSKRKTIPVTKDLGRILGWYIAEGSINRNRICFCIHENEVDEVAELIESVFFGMYGGKLAIRRKIGSKGVILEVNSKVLALFLSGLLPGRAWEKTIPDIFWDFGVDFNEGLLEGIIRGDGSILEKTRVTIVTTSSRLAYQFRLMAASLNIGLLSVRESESYRYGIRNRNRFDIIAGGEANKEIRKRFCFVDEYMGTQNTSFKDRLGKGLYLKLGRSYRSYMWARVRSITKISSPDFVYDLLLPDEPHSYLTNSGIVSNCTELAFWDKPDEKMLAIENAVPKDGKIIIESTPNGVGNLYHRMWMADNNGYAKKKYGWWWGYTEEEIEVIRGRINNPMKFAQEYGLEFLASGRPVFPTDLIKRLRKGVFHVGDRVMDDNGVEHTVTKTEDDMVIFFPSTPGKTYVAGVDVAEGVTGGDYSVVTIFDRETGHEVACWRGYLAPDRFGLFLNKVGRQYNNALMVVEINNHGLTTVTALKNAMYPQIYFRPVVKMDTMGTQFSDRMGWKTTKVTRPLMIDDLREALSDGSLKIHSEKTLDEFLTFVFDDGGNMVTQNAFHDDCIFSTAIAFQGFKVMYSGELSQIDYEKHMPESSSY